MLHSKSIPIRKKKNSETSKIIFLPASLNKQSTFVKVLHHSSHIGVRHSRFGLVFFMFGYNTFSC